MAILSSGEIDAQEDHYYIMDTNAGPLGIRPFQREDIEPIVAYWHQADPQVLASRGIDYFKIGTKEAREKRLKALLKTDRQDRKFDHLILTFNREAIGSISLTEIEQGFRANAHALIWDADLQNRGIGKNLLIPALKIAFELYNLKVIVGEPKSDNKAINRLLKSLGLNPTKTYITTPSPVCFEMEVNRYEISFTQL